MRGRAVPAPVHGPDAWAKERGPSHELPRSRRRKEAEWPAETVVRLLTSAATVQGHKARPNGPGILSLKFPDNPTIADRSRSEALGQNDGATIAQAFARDLRSVGGLDLLPAGPSQRFQSRKKL